MNTLNVMLCQCYTAAHDPHLAIEDALDLQSILAGGNRVSTFYTSTLMVRVLCCGGCQGTDYSTLRGYDLAYAR